jgi:alpha-1,2-glucosyltransferase
MSLVVKKVFMLKCNLPMLRLTVTLTLLALPLVLTRLLCFHQRVRLPPSIATPTPDAIILAALPIVWFYGFLYYTDVPSLLFVVATVAEAMASRHWSASLVRDAFSPVPRKKSTHQSVM